MDRRILAINNWVTARYFKKSDVDTFFRNLEVFIKKVLKYIRILAFLNR